VSTILSYILYETKKKFETFGDKNYFGGILAIFFMITFGEFSKLFYDFVEEFSIFDLATLFCMRVTVLISCGPEYSNEHNIIMHDMALSVAVQPIDKNTNR